MEPLVDVTKHTVGNELLDVIWESLERCPFCGNCDTMEGTEVSKIRVNDHDIEITEYYVYCFTCGAEGPHSKSLSIAYLKWNDRN